MSIFIYEDIFNFAHLKREKLYGKLLHLLECIVNINLANIWCRRIF